THRYRAADHGTVPRRRHTTLLCGYRPGAAEARLGTQSHPGTRAGRSGGLAGKSDRRRSRAGGPGGTRGAGAHDMTRNAKPAASRFGSMPRSTRTTARLLRFSVFISTITPRKTGSLVATDETKTSGTGRDPSHAPD